MRKRGIGLTVALSALLFASGVRAQESGLAAACGQLDDDNLALTCLVAAQAAQSTPAQFGMLVAGGNPTIGTASGGGLRLGRLPGVSATLRAGIIQLRAPALRDVQISPTDAVSYGELSLAAPVLSGTASVALFPGVGTAPTIGGIGSVDLLASASWLPIKVVDGGEFRSGTADVAWGAGVRVGLVRESFTLPGASISVMHHRLGSVQYGRICRNRAVTGTSSGPGYELEQGGCVMDPFGMRGDDRDLGEVAFDLSSWSTRAVVSKQLLGLGLSAGLGYDRVSSDVEVGVRAARGPWSPISDAYARVTGVDLSDSRWSAFLNGSYSLLVATFAAELGWMQGGDAVADYPDSTSDFDPGDGSLFGSLGIRIAL